MRICALVLGGILAFGTAARAQDVQVGVKGGVNLANLEFEAEGVDVNFERRTGFVGGLFVVWPLGGQVGLQTEALYSQRGAEIEDPDVDATGKVKLDYLEVPVLLRLSTPASSGTSFHVFAGPSLGFRVRARGEGTVGNFTETEDLSDEIEKFDLGLSIGAGADFNRLIVDGRYTWGLSNLNKDDSDNVEVKNRTFSVMLGIRF